MSLSLAQRLQCVEDELAIRNCVARYGMAVDCGATEAALACHTPDARYIVSAPATGREGDESVAGTAEDLVLAGRAAIAAMLESDLHHSMLPRCAHTVGPLQVELGGDAAQVHGYSRLYLREGESFRLLRVAVNRWQMQRCDGNWLIACRESRLVGEQAAQALLQEHFQQTV
jgi:ketosteroid isomerase-like protein